VIEKVGAAGGKLKDFQLATTASRHNVAMEITRVPSAHWPAACKKYLVDHSLQDVVPALEVSNRIRSMLSHPKRHRKAPEIHSHLA